MNRPLNSFKSLVLRDVVIAAVALVAVALHLVLRFVLATEDTLLGIKWPTIPLLVALVVGGIPLVGGLVARLARFEFSSDLLAGISIVTAVVLGEYLAGTLVVLMLSGGQALEAYAVRKASSALLALARRMPSQAHRKQDGSVAEIPLEDVSVGDLLVVLPHETCPVDAIVVEGHSTMDESYLTGEPYVLSKAAGSAVMSGAINGDGALTIRAEKAAVDSRYAKIMQVMRESEQRRPRLRRLGDRIGAIYTPLAIAIALLAWAASSDAQRFLAVLVVATPCPLLIGIPVAIIGSVSLAARRGIVIKDPAVLEGTLRYRDEPRAEGNAFIQHLKPRHRLERILLVSGDRESEVRYLAEIIGINEVFASQSPEQKLSLVREETRKAATIFVGDGINDAPALTAATVGVAFGKASDVTAQAAGAVILESSLVRVDELLHIGRRMRSIALQTAIGGMTLSVAGMFLAAAGYLPPVAGAVTQEVIDVLAVLNGLRASLTPRALTDC